MMTIQLYHAKGLSHLGQNQYEQALVVFDKARALCDATVNMALKATILSNLVHVYDYLAAPQSSIQYIKQYIELAAIQVPYDSLSWSAGQFNLAMTYVELYMKDTTAVYLDTVLLCLNTIIPYYKNNENYK